MRNVRSSAASRGFTLLELIVVVAILAILGALAGPSFVTTLATQRLRNGSFDLVGDLLLARGEALKRQTNIVITPSATSGSEWITGWTINVGTSAGALVTSRLGLASKLRFAATDSSGNALTSLTFGPDGRLPPTTATPVKINVKSADLGPNKWSCILLDATGRARADKGGCS